MSVLSRYIAKENSRPEAERFTKPDLAEIIEVWEQLRANKKTYQSSHIQRKSSRAARDSALQQLKDNLRVAGALIITKHFGGAISLDLGKWGFEVFERSTKADEQPEDDAQENGADATTDASYSTNGSINVNGSSEAALKTLANNDKMG